ncbi:hypothetical protein BC834DRAFT_121832 [Gloeopeniophorella convolvens]|nr:hypothetical protein BC834DRAFT_121832 [Gloeopeniophorella convolvens]
MKSLLRKKPPTESRQKAPSPPYPPQNTRAAGPPPAETPLYARFTSAKSGQPSQDRVRPVVSGPMPLGRPSHRGSVDAEEHRRRQDEAALQRYKSSTTRQDVPHRSQTLPAPPPRDAQAVQDRTYHDGRVSLAPAARQPVNAQPSASLGDQYPTSRYPRASAPDNVQQPRDTLPSPPVSPRSSPYLQHAVSSVAYQPPNPSPPAVTRSYGVATQSVVAARVYGEPRQATAMAAEIVLPMVASIHGQAAQMEVCI